MSVTDVFNTMSYGPSPQAGDNVDSWLEQHKKGFQLFIKGQWRSPVKEKYFNSVNPATGQVLAKVSQAGKEDIDAAVQAARCAQPEWEKLSGHHRARYLYALARLLQKHSRRFAVLESMDNGKPIRETRDIDIPLAVRHFYYHAGWAQLVESEISDHEALGVVGQIIPWNFPLLMLAWKIAPALAAGNCVVLKPAEFTSLSALMFAQLCQEVGLPPGVVNIVTGDGVSGAFLVEHPDINKLAFTGSTEVGRQIKERTAGSEKKLTLELGGKSPFIVFDDADLDSAVEGLVDAIWFNQGEVCCAGSRLLVQESVAELMLAKIKIRMKKLRVGNPLDKNTDVGAIVDQSQVERIDSLVKQGVAQGATLWRAEGDLPEQGCFYPPTLLTDVESHNIVAIEEIFGPVLSVLSFRTQQEAITLANNTRYGLAASVWSESISRALDVAPQIKAGVVWINSTNQFDAACGFGGYRESGFGREGGIEGLYEYLKPIVSDFIEKGGFVENLTEKKIKKSPKKNQQTIPIDQTAKQYIGGKQVRADSGNSIHVLSRDGACQGFVGEGNRKDVRNAVEAAHKAQGWSKTSAHARAQILFYIAENLSYRSDEFAQRLVSLTLVSDKKAQEQVTAAIERLFYYAAWADKFDGVVHQPPMRGVTLAMNESLGVMGIACPDSMPLLSFISLLAPAIAMGNRVVIIPSTSYPLIATDFYQVLSTSDVPAGVVNIVTGDRDGLIKVLAEHKQVDGVWYQGTKQGSAMLERASTSNLKRTWVNYGVTIDWFSKKHAEGKRFLREATQVKNIWVPYGDIT
ncbi:MAG: aldehyde dehydrogenase family protein [Spongiibacteraceae bacterium]|nr:aldehyde dehydrogenase family protein [Spongiibacteraceae bacterium]